MCAGDYFNKKMTEPGNLEFDFSLPNDNTISFLPGAVIKTNNKVRAWLQGLTALMVL